MVLVVRKLATWPRAWTPASVRPEPMSVDRLPGETLQGLFQDLLNGEVALLALPAVVASAVVFQKEADIAGRHG